MRACIGVAWHSPFVLKQWVADWLETLSEEHQDAMVLQFLNYGDVEFKDDLILAFAPSLNVLMRNLDALYDMPSEPVVVVFDTPIVLEQAKISLLDARSTDGIRYTRQDMSSEQFIFKLRAAMNREAFGVEPEAFDLVPNLINNVAGSLTEAVLNLTAGCRVPERRREIVTAYANWLLSARDFQPLMDQLAALGVDDDSIHAVVAWLQTKTGSAARQVCKRIAAARREKKNVNYDKLCAGTPVSAFDIKFLLGYVRSAAVESVGKDTRQIFDERARVRASQPDKGDDLAEMLVQDEIDMGVGTDELSFAGLDDITY